MLNSLNVYYNGWGESWLWGTLISSTATTGRPTIAFEPYRVCRRVNILRDYPDDKIKIYP